MRWSGRCVLGERKQCLSLGDPDLTQAEKKEKKKKRKEKKRNLWEVGVAPLQVKSMA